MIDTFLVVHPPEQYGCNAADIERSVLRFTRPFATARELQQLSAPLVAALFGKSDATGRNSTDIGPTINNKEAELRGYILDTTVGIDATQRSAIERAVRAAGYWLYRNGGATNPAVWAVARDITVSVAGENDIASPSVASIAPSHHLVLVLLRADDSTDDIFTKTLWLVQECIFRSLPGGATPDDIDAASAQLICEGVIPFHMYETNRKNIPPPSVVTTAALNRLECFLGATIGSHPV